MNLNGTEWVLSLSPRESVCLLECVPQLEWCLGRNVLGDDDSFVTYDVTASLYSGFSSKCQLDVYKSSWAGSSAIQEEALREPIIPITVLQSICEVQQVFMQQYSTVLRQYSSDGQIFIQNLLIYRQQSDSLVLYHAQQPSPSEAAIGWFEQFISTSCSAQ